MKRLADVSLMFAYQLTGVVNVTMQMINVTVLDHCKLADISSVHWHDFECDSCIHWGTVLATSKVVDSWRRVFVGIPTICSLRNPVFVDQLAVLCGSMSVHVFLHSNPVFVSLGEGYEMCRLNFLMRYVIFHSISKYAMDIVSQRFSCKIDTEIYHFSCSAFYSVFGVRTSKGKQ